MPPPGLTTNHIFGFNEQIRHGLVFLEDSVVLFPAGRSIVLHHLESKQQRFIHCSRSTLNYMGSSKKDGHVVPEFTAIALSPNKRYIAIAERSEKNTITVYDLRTLKVRKILSTKLVTSTEWLSLCFSPDNKSLLSISGGPSYKLVHWQWEKTKVLSAVPLLTEEQDAGSKTSETLFEKKKRTLSSSLQCSFSPDGSTVVVTGHNVMHWLELDPETRSFKTLMVQLPGEADRSMRCHCWMPGRLLLIGCANGDIIGVKDTDFDGLMSLPNSGKAEDNAQVSCMQPFSKGVLVGTSRGCVHVLQFAEEQEETGQLDTLFQWGRSFDVDATAHQEDVPSARRSAELERKEEAGTGNEAFGNFRSIVVRSVTVSPSEELMAVALSNSQLQTLRLADGGLSKVQRTRFKQLTELWHHGPITGLDTCSRKPIFATCGADCTVRLWNYLTHEPILCKLFPETPLCVALHPSGLHLAVGFTDKLRLFNVLLDDLRCFKELPPKSSNEVQFSRGGQFFACSSVGHVIQVYSTYKCELLHTFRGHTAPIRSIYWTLDDTSIVSAGSDGAVYARRLNEAHRWGEYVLKSAKFASALCTADDKIYVVGNDGYLKEIVDNAVNKNIDAGVVCTQLLLSHPPQRMLFVGTSIGVVRAFKFPLTGESDDFVCHSRPILRARISIDDGVLITVCEGGIIMVHDVKERDGRLAKRDRADTLAMAEEVLITKSDLEDKQTTMKDLQTEVDELTVQNDYQLRLHDMNNQEKLKHETEKFKLQLEHDKSKYDMLFEETQDLKAEYEEKVRQLRAKQAQELHELDLQQQQAIMIELKRFQELEEEAKNKQKEQEGRSFDRKRGHEKQVEDLRFDFARKMEAEDELLRRAEAAKQLVIRKFKETTRQLEEDTDREIEEMKAKYEAKLHMERDATLRLKGENGIMKKKFGALKKDIEDQKEDLKAMVSKETQLYAHIRQLKNEIKRHKQEIDRRDATIGEKETGIYDLKKENQELEKYKFVLDFQIKELKRQIEPRENQIEQMKETIKKLDRDLERFHKENAVQTDLKAHLTEELREKRTRIKSHRQLLRRSEILLKRLKDEIYQLVPFIQDPLRLKQAVQRLSKDYITSVVTQAEIEPDVKREYLRQEAFLEKSIDELKKESKEETAMRKADTMRILQENVALLEEITDLRAEIKRQRHAKRERESMRSLERARAGQGRRKPRPPPPVGWDDKEAVKVMRMQLEQVQSLRQQIEEEKRVMAVRTRRGAEMNARPVSRERLPPL